MKRLRAGRARLIRAGVEAAHLPHGLRAVWIVEHLMSCHPLTRAAYLRRTGDLARRGVG